MHFQSHQRHVRHVSQWNKFNWHCSIVDIFLVCSELDFVVVLLEYISAALVSVHYCAAVPFVASSMSTVDSSGPFFLPNARFPYYTCVAFAAQNASTQQPSSQSRSIECTNSHRLHRNGSDAGCHKLLHQFMKMQFIYSSKYITLPHRIRVYSVLAPALAYLLRTVPCTLSKSNFPNVKKPGAKKSHTKRTDGRWSGRLCVCVSVMSLFDSVHSSGSCNWISTQWFIYRIRSLLINRTGDGFLFVYCMPNENGPAQNQPYIVVHRIAHNLSIKKNMSVKMESAADGGRQATIKS